MGLCGFRVFGSFSCVYISVYALGVKVGDLENVCGGLWDVNGGDIQEVLGV